MVNHWRRIAARHIESEGEKQMGYCTLTIFADKDAATRAVCSKSPPSDQSSFDWRGNVKVTQQPQRSGPTPIPGKAA